MVNVFLVDDDAVFREKVKRYIDWRIYGMKLVGEASNGSSAYTLIQETRPDILITDIQIPFMDGLRLSELVKKKLPDIRIIIVSEYEYFSYARKALRLGVADYQTKPVKLRSLLESILKEKNKIEVSRLHKKEIERLIHKRIGNGKNASIRFFHDLISGRVSEIELINRGKLQGIDLEAKMYNIILLQFFWKKPWSCCYEEECAIESKLVGMLGTGGNAVRFRQEGNGDLILIKSADRITLDTDVERIISEILEILNTKKDVRYFIGVGKAVPSLRDLPQCYQSANKMFAHRYVTGWNQIFYSCEWMDRLISDTDQIDFNKINFSELEKNSMEHFLKNGLKSDIPAITKAYMKNMGIENLNSLAFRQFSLIKFNYTVIRFVKELEMKKRQLKSIFSGFGDLEWSMESLSQTEDYIRKSIDACLLLRDQAAGSKYSELMGKAKDYIIKYYTDEKISLSLAAAKVNMSPNHFSRVFRKEADKTFIEFLIELRINKAKQLLKCTDMKISDIGFEIGYKDARYFSYLFKKVVGCTPRDYRMKSIDAVEKELGRFSASDLRER